MSAFMRRMGLTVLALLAGAASAAQAQTVVRYVHTDALGSVVAITDQNRVVIERREYEPYGQQLTPAVQDGPGYTGHVQDAATGLTYMQQRYYDSGGGRFLSVDPVTVDGNTGGNFNRYLYAAGNPYRFMDPDGRQEVEANTCSRAGGASCAGSYETGSSTVPQAPYAYAELNRSMAAPRQEGFFSSLTRNGNILDVEALGHDLMPALEMPQLGGGLKLAGSLLFAFRIGRGVEAFGGLSRAGQFGIQSYGRLSAKLSGTGLEAHHLIPQRFAGLMGQNVNQMASVAVTQAEHKIFTNAWRTAIPYGAGTRSATREQVMQEAARIYANNPAILQALGL